MGGAAAQEERAAAAAAAAAAAVHARTAEESLRQGVMVAMKGRCLCISLIHNATQAFDCTEVSPWNLLRDLLSGSICMPLHLRAMSAEVHPSVFWGDLWCSSVRRL